MTSLEYLSDVVHVDFKRRYLLTYEVDDYDDDIREEDEQLKQGPIVVLAEYIEVIVLN